MARSNRILALDIGAASVKVAEFEYVGDGGVTLVDFDYREYGEDLIEETRSITITSVLREMLMANSFTATNVLLSISGQFALTRFVKLPPVAEEENRVRQIVEFEARQNVPFPMEEVIWDYQLIANPEADELEVMFVVIKNEIVEQITSAVQAVGLQPILVDVAPSACYNAARANHIGDSECAMILNLGARSTNLLFADRAKFFARTIPIAGHSITQQIAKEFGIGMEEAEELKRRHGFVALGGAYAEPESEVAGAVSKIVRNVMTRLHGEINRSIGVYRAQQKGNVPKRLFLTGGSSTMGFTDKFFSEKLGIPVEYLNPFQVVRLHPGINADRLQEVAHMFSEIIGLGLRYCVQCPVEVSLMPEAITRQVALRQKKPYLVACVACVLLMMVVTLLATMRRETRYARLFDTFEGEKTRLEGLQAKIVKAERDRGKQWQQYSLIESILRRRESWPEVLTGIEALRPANLWLYSLTPVVQRGTAASLMLEGGAPRMRPPSDPGPAAFPFGGPGGGPGGGYGGPMGSATPAAPAAAQLQPITIAEIQVQGHSLELPAGLQVASPDAPAQPEAVADPVELFAHRLAQSELFDAERTTLTSYKAHDRIANLKTFSLRIVLKEPITITYE